VVVVVGCTAFYSMHLLGSTWLFRVIERVTGSLTACHSLQPGSAKRRVLSRISVFGGLVVDDKTGCCSWFEWFML
jgi:hypothetical protein